MLDLEAITNKGLCVVGGEPNLRPGDAATLIVLGPARSGTSAIAGALHHLGVFLGDKAAAPVFEDTRLAGAFSARDDVAIEAIVREYDGRHAIWGFKRPDFLNAAQEMSGHFRNPRYIVTFKDVLSIANRNKLSAKTELLPGIQRALTQYGMILKFLEQPGVVSLLVSYEKLLEHRELAVRTMAEFGGLAPSEAQLAAATAFVQPNPPAYLVASRTDRTRGVLDRVTSSSVNGWARYVRGEHPATVVLLVNGVEVARAVADRFRPDLLKRKVHSEGKCGFLFEGLPAGTLRPGAEVRVRVAGDVQDLAKSPGVVPGAAEGDTELAPSRPAESSST